MGTQGAGRKRSTNKERTTAEDDALNLIAREAEARLAAKRAARAEAREIRMKELERQQKELSDEDERMSVGSRGSVRVDDGNYLEKGPRVASALTATTLTSLGGTSSRRGSGETALTLDAETSLREIKEIHELKDQIQDVESKYSQNLKEAKDKLSELEEKYRKAMVSNAQLDNEKNNLMYQVDTLKDSLMELEEQLTESRREYEDKAKDFERERHAHTVLQFQFNELRETLKQSEELLNKHGIVLGPDLNINGSVADTVSSEDPSADPASPSAQETPCSPTDGGNSMLGNTEEETNNQKEETHPEQTQEKDDDNFEDNCPESNDTKVEICVLEEQLASNSELLNSISNAKEVDQVDSGTTFEKIVVEEEPIEQNVIIRQELEATQKTIASQQTSQDPSDKQPRNIEEVDFHQEIEMGSKQPDKAAKERTLAAKGMTEEPMVAASRVEDLEALDGDSEGVSSKTQTTSGGGKKKKRKKRGKKKGAVSENKNDQQKVITKQDSKSEECGTSTQDNNGLLKDQHSYKVTCNAQANVEASKGDSEQMVKEAGPAPKVENDAETKSLLDNIDKVALKDAVTAVEDTGYCLETGGETAFDSSRSESLESTDVSESTNAQSLNDGGQEIQSEAGMEVRDGNDHKDVHENVVVTKSVDNDVENEQSSSDIASLQECDGLIDEMVEQNLDISQTESEQAFFSSNSEVNVQDNGTEESLGPELVGKDVSYEIKDLDIEESSNSVDEIAIVSNNESPILQNMIYNKEPIANDANVLQAVDSTCVEELSKVRNEKSLIEEEEDVETTAISVNDELRSSQTEPVVANLVDLSTEHSNVDVDVTSVENEQSEQTVEVGVDVLEQEDISKDHSTDDIPQASDTELNVDNAGAENMDGRNDENKEVEGTLAKGEDQVEVGVDVLVEDDISKDQSVRSDPQTVSHNIENEKEKAQPLVDIVILAVDDSKDLADSREVVGQNQMENVCKEFDVVEVKSEGTGQSACDDIGHREQGMEEVKAKLLVDIEISVEDNSDLAENCETHVQNQIDNGRKELEIEVKESEALGTCQDFETGSEVLVDQNSIDLLTNSEAQAQNQTETGNMENDVVDTRLEMVLELVKDDTDKVEEAEIVVEDVAEDDLKGQSIENKSQNHDKELENQGSEPESLVLSDSIIETCHVVGLSENDALVEVDPCNPVVPVGEEGEEEGEGLSFDFDDLELEAAIALSSESKTAEEDVEMAVEALVDEGKDDLVEKRVESADVDNACRDKVEVVSSQKDNDGSLDGASLAEPSETSQDKTVQGVKTTLQDSNENRHPSSEIQKKDLESGKNRQETGANSEPARSGKEAKRSGKKDKSKGKGKDECKMT